VALVVVVVAGTLVRVVGATVGGRAVIVLVNKAVAAAPPMT
jgi:hypothetical protein